MSTKPPKGIQEKIVVDAVDAEVLWHLLSDLPDANINGLEHWDTLAFGLLGGVDVGQQSNLLRDRPVRVQVQTHRASFQRFCQTLQVGFEEYNLHNQWTVDEVDDLLEMTDNIFYINKKGVWKLCVDHESDSAVWWAENRFGKSWHRENLHPNAEKKFGWLKMCLPVRCKRLFIWCCPSSVRTLSILQVWNLKFKTGFITFVDLLYAKVGPTF